MFKDINALEAGAMILVTVAVLTQLVRRYHLYILKSTNSVYLIRQSRSTDIVDWLIR